MSKPRVALVGCGGVAEFHVPAFRAAGFEVRAVCARTGSPRLRSFAERHNIPRVFEHYSDLLSAHREWDALVIAVPVEATLEVLEHALETKAPILVEKPVSCNSKDLARLAKRDLPVIVGYNRRFYRTTLRAREEVAARSPLLGHLSLPESIAAPGAIADNPGYLKSFFTNSVHGLDMARFVFGDLKIVSVQRMTNSGNAVVGLVASLSGTNGSLVQFTANWGTPANFSLTLDSPGRRFELRPFEVATVYGGMQVREPTPEIPIRTYTPVPSEKIGLDDLDYEYKPGFVAQAKALAALIRGEDPFPAARLEDAHAVLGLAEGLLGQTYGSGSTVATR